VKLSVVNAVGKDAVVAILGSDDFRGEGCLAGQTIGMGTATAITPTTALTIGNNEMLRVLHEEHEFSDRFIACMLGRNIRIEEDLVDQLFTITPPRNAWRALCCYSRAMGNKTRLKRCFPKYRKRC